MTTGASLSFMLIAVVTTLAACGAGSNARVKAGVTSSSPTTSSESPSSTAPAPSSTTGPTATEVTPSTVPGLPPEQPTGAAAITLTSADLTAIGVAFAQFTSFTACAVQPVPGQMKAAVVTATGVKWAFGPLQPVAGCTVNVDGAPVSPYRTPPFGGEGTSSAVFTDPPGGTWQVNWLESDPFPCPADLNKTRLSPGPGSPAVPLAVLNAVGVLWSSSPKCNTASEYIPTTPRG